MAVCAQPWALDSYQPVLVDLPVVLRNELGMQRKVAHSLFFPLSGKHGVLMGNLAGEQGKVYSLSFHRLGGKRAFNQRGALPFSLPYLTAEVCRLQRGIQRHPVIWTLLPLQPPLSSLHAKDPLLWE